MNDTKMSKEKAIQLIKGLLSNIRALNKFRSEYIDECKLALTVIAATTELTVELNRRKEICLDHAKVYASSTIKDSDKTSLWMSYASFFEETIRIIKEIEIADCQFKKG